ncbi:MFS transporter [Streptomyces sp. HD1123-B1]|uniref:MFS transporter n=1 Tax=Streptomyces huangiella TaxID=3228804 RepID=UPI003D7C8C5A
MPATHPPEARSSARSPVRHGLVLVVTCLALGAVVAAMSSLNVGLPLIARDTHASQTQLSWIIDAYSLVFASLLLPAGTLGDRFGRRRALLIGLTVFGAASACAPFTSDPDVLIGCRAVLGVGAALVMPATLSTITGTFPKEQRARGVGVWAAVAGGSAVIGVLVSGVLLEFWSWEAIFVFNVVVAAVALVGTLLYVPESADDNPPKVDVTGAVLVVAGLAVLVYSVIEAPVHGWSAARTLGGIAAGLVLVAGFTGWSLRRRDPLLDPRLFRNPRFAAASLSIMLQFFGFFGYIFVMMQYLQMIREDSALVAALSLLPMAVVMVPSARLAPRLTARLGIRGPWVTGLVLVAVGLATLAQLTEDSPYAFVAAGLVPLGIGMGIATTPATTAITDALPKALQNVGSAMNDLSRELGGALGIAVLGSVLSTGYRENLELPGIPEHMAEAARSSFAAATAIGGPVVDPARSAFIDGLHGALLGGAGVALVGAVVVFVLLGRPHHAAQDTGTPDAGTSDAGAEDPGTEATGEVRSIPSAGRRARR